MDINMDANMPYLLSAYAVFWGLTFALVFSIWLRQRRLEREIAALQVRLAQQEGERE